MKFLPLLFLFLCISFRVSAQHWELIWSDEFDYEGLPNPQKWSFDVEGNSWDWGNNELQNYTPAEKRNAWVENGYLVIEARKEDWVYPGDGQNRNYTSARLRTYKKGDWLYGKVEVKAQIPGGRGTWPAIWMLPTDNSYGTWPRSGELDIMEHVGFDPQRVHFTVHTERYNHMNGNQKGANRILNNPITDFFVYSMEWFPSQANFFANGEKIFTFSNEGSGWQAWPFDKRFHLLLNIAIGGSWGGQQGVDNNIFPVRMLVDYVRVYRQSNTILTTMKTKHPSFKIGQNPVTKLPLLTYSFNRETSFSINLYSSAGVLISSRNIVRQDIGSTSILSPAQKNLVSGVYFITLRFNNATPMLKNYSQRFVIF